MYEYSKEVIINSNFWFLQYLLKGYLVLLLLPSKSFSQKVAVGDSFVDCLVDYCGSNDIIINGDRYYNASKGINGTPYLLGNNYKNGTVFIGGKSFIGLRLKYNIVSDELILLHETGFKKEVLVLNSEFVDSFYIASNENDGYFTFYSNRALNIDKDISNYFRVLYKGKDIFLYKYEKKLYKLYSEINPHGVYGKTKRKLFVYSNGGLYLLKGRRSFLNRFKKYKKELKSYIKANRIQFGKSDDEKLISLFGFLEIIYKKTDDI